MLVSIFDAVIMLLLGFVSGILYRFYLCRRNPDWFVFLTVSIVGLFWLDALLVFSGYTPWAFAPAIDLDSALVGVFYVLSYPLWFRFGGGVSFILFGRTPQEGGITWVFSMSDRTEGFSPDWKN